jgi:hypothetical protein
VISRWCPNVSTIQGRRISKILVGDSATYRLIAARIKNRKFRGME